MLQMDLASILSFYNILYTFLGTVIGIVIGALPGLTPTMGVALFLPFTFGMPATASFGMLLGIYVGGVYGGSIPAVLIRTPGTPASAATVLDGYPLAQSGKAGEALSITCVASFFGGIISCIVLMLLSGKIASVALKFGPAEYFAVGLFGLSVVASFCSSGSVAKGMISVCVGLFMSCIGMDSLTGFQRFTYGSTNLLAGVSEIAALIGFFAFAEVLRKASETRSDAKKVVAKVSTEIVNPILFVKNAWNILRSAIIGTFIGIVPAVGTGTAAWISYNEARRASKHPERFGKGSEEAIIAAEAANNAVTGGAMIPLLTLALPGDTVTAVLLGALTVKGLAAGPLLFSQHPDVVQGIYIMMIVANIFMVLLGLLGLKGFAQIVKLPNSILMPLVIVLCFVGTYAIGGKVFDMETAFLIGLMGLVFYKCGIPIPPALLGLILGPTVEKNLRRALLLSKGSASIFFTKPIACAFILLSIFSFVFTLTRGILARRKAEKAALAANAAEAVKEEE